MGHKVNPIGLRLGLKKDWRSRWFDQRNFAKKLIEDEKIRRLLSETLGRGAAVAEIEIVRSLDTTKVVILTGRPGIIIGRGGQGISKLKSLLDKKLKGKFTIDVVEVKKPELSASLVSQNLASQISRRVSYRRTAKWALRKVMDAGAKGVKIILAGRLGGAEIARSEKFTEGIMPLSTLRANIDYSLSHAQTTYGTIGVKVWIYLGSDQKDKKIKENAYSPQA